MIHKYLAYLKTIETGSITQAAAELGYTQSAVSRMIADLEEHWDVPLLTRNRSGIEISSEGTQLLPILQSCHEKESLCHTGDKAADQHCGDERQVEVGIGLPRAYKAQHQAGRQAVGRALDHHGRHQGRRRHTGENA